MQAFPKEPENLAPMEDAVGKLTSRFLKKRAVITGAASGLGRAPSLEFARAGWWIGLGFSQADSSIL
jgi:hypothetical protein